MGEKQGALQNVSMDRESCSVWAKQPQEMLICSSMTVQMDIYSLSRKWKELVDKARAKQLSPQEYTTGLNLSIQVRI